MTPTPLLDAYTKAVRTAAALLAEIKAVRPNQEDLMERLGATKNDVTKLLKNSEYFDNEQLDQMRGLSFDVIFSIGKFCRKLSNRGVNPLEFFSDAVQFARQATLDELEEHLATIVAKHNEECADKPRADWARFSATADCDGKSYLNIKAPAEDLARVRSVIDDEAKSLFHQGHAHSIAEAYAHIITRRVISFGQVPESTETETEDPNPLTFKYRPFVSICHPLLLENHDGKYVTTDGTLVDLQEYADQMLEPFGWAVVPYRNHSNEIEYSEPMEIAVRHPGRLANPAQRLILTAAHPVCAHPDCRTAARFCQIHHIVSWAAGGRTELSNMVPACMRHNKRNDDDPEKPKNGRIEKDPLTGRVGYRRYPDSPLRFSRAPTVKYGMFEQARAFFDRLDEAQLPEVA